MRTLVLGGIRSGKSDWAESAISRASGAAPVRYLATGAGETSDESWSARVAEHRSRRPSSWVTVETGDLPGELRAEPGAPTLVDDIGGWLTALLDRHGWDGRPLDDEVHGLLGAVGDFIAPLILVSPEVGLGVIPATDAGRRFADELGALNQRLAVVCERVVLVVAGQPVWVKPAAKEPI